MAFSRDQPEKIYVTHLLEQNADELWNIIGEKNGHLYVCGYVSTVLNNCVIILNVYHI